MMVRIAGATLFLPVPVVLWLFTRSPLGTGLSLLAGVALMATHRLYARPFALRHAGRRCLWCGRVATHGVELRVREPGGETTWRACSAAHADRQRRVLGWASRHARALRIGILGSLGAYLALQLLDLAGLSPWSPADTVNLFRVGVSAAVLPMGWLSPRAAAAPDAPLSSPFPLHIQALLGTRIVLWLFRIVGLIWLALGVVHVVQQFPR